MAKISWYSNSKEFLSGVSWGIGHVGDSAIDISEVMPSDNTDYSFMILEDDREAPENVNMYFDGISLKYTETK